MSNISRDRKGSKGMAVKEEQGCRFRSRKVALSGGELHVHHGE